MTEKKTAATKEAAPVEDTSAQSTTPASEPVVKPYITDEPGAASPSYGGVPTALVVEEPVEAESKS